MVLRTTGAANRTSKGAPFRMVLGCTWLMVAFTLAASGCTRTGEYQSDNMWDGSRLKPMEAGPLPGSLSSARPLVPGTMAQGEFRRNDPFATGRVGNRLVERMPVAVTPELLRVGQEQFNVYCSPCHSRVGDGQGMVVKRGFPNPPDYAIPRLRQAPDGHFFDVISNGYGVMYSYAGRVPIPDRWAIIAYIRLLQARRPVVPPEQGDTLGATRERAPGVNYRPEGR